MIELIKEIKRIAEASFKSGWYSHEIETDFDKAFKAWKVRLSLSDVKDED